MSLAAMGTAANVLGVIMPVRDIGEIIKGVAEWVEEVCFSYIAKKKVR